MKSDLELFVYVLQQIDELIEYYREWDEDMFLRDNVTKDACLMKLLVIGEYSSRISGKQKDRFTEIEWQALRGTRNFFAHAYGLVTWTRVWETLSEDIPKLREKLVRVITVLEKENNAKTN